MTRFVPFTTMSRSCMDTLSQRLRLIRLWAPCLLMMMMMIAQSVKEFWWREFFHFNLSSLWLVTISPVTVHYHYALFVWLIMLTTTSSRLPSYSPYALNHASARPHTLATCQIKCIFKICRRMDTNSNQGYKYFLDCKGDTDVMYILGFN